MLEKLATSLSLLPTNTFMAGTDDTDMSDAFRSANATLCSVPLGPLSAVNSRKLVGKRFLADRYSEWQDDATLQDLLAYCGGIPRALTQLVLALFTDGRNPFFTNRHNGKWCLETASKTALWNEVTFASAPRKGKAKAWRLNLNLAVVGQVPEKLNDADDEKAAKSLLPHTVLTIGDVPYFAPVQVASITDSSPSPMFSALSSLNSLATAFRYEHGSAAVFKFEEVSMDHFRARCHSWANLKFGPVFLRSLLGLDLDQPSVIPDIMVDLPAGALDRQEAKTAFHFFEEDGTVVPFDYPENVVLKNAPNAKNADWAVKLRTLPGSQYDYVVLAFQNKARAYYNEAGARQSVADVFGHHGMSARKCGTSRELLVFVLQSVGGTAIELEHEPERHVVIQQGVDLLKFFGPTVTALAFHWNLGTCSTSALQQLLGVSSQDNRAVQLIDEARKLPGSLKSLDDVEAILNHTEASKSIKNLRQLEDFGALSCCSFGH